MAAGWRLAAAGALQVIVRSAVGGAVTRVPSPSWSRSRARPPMKLSVLWLVNHRVCRWLPAVSGCDTTRGLAGRAIPTNVGESPARRRLNVEHDGGSWGLTVAAHNGPAEDGTLPCCIEPPRLAPSQASTIRHAHSPVSGPAWEALATFMGWREDRARELITFGGFYYKPHGWPDSAKPKRELDPMRPVELGEYFRVFPEPKRYHACSGVDWESRIVYETEDLMLVNKPPGIPCHPTVDNFRENMLTGLREARPGLAPLLPHRLDIDTCGLVMVAKTHEILGMINDAIRAPVRAIQDRSESPKLRKLRRKELHAAAKAKAKAISKTLLTVNIPDKAGPNNTSSPSGATQANVGAAVVSGRVTKRYRALVNILPGATPLSPGPLTHFLRNSPRSPKQFVKERPPGSESNEEEELKFPSEPTPWLECRMLVLSVRDAEEPDGCGRAVLRLQEVEVELLTGRTHQIRGQLAAEGCPIYGDCMYGPARHQQTPHSMESSSRIVPEKTPRPPETERHITASRSTEKTTGGDLRGQGRQLSRSYRVAESGTLGNGAGGVGVAEKSPTQRGGDILENQGGTCERTGGSPPEMGGGIVEKRVGRVGAVEGYTPEQVGSSPGEPEGILQGTAGTRIGPLAPGPKMIPLQNPGSRYCDGECGTVVGNDAEISRNDGVGEVARGHGEEGVLRVLEKFVESPLLALQANEILLEIGGKVHSYRLPQDSCWWYSGDQHLLQF